MSIEPETLKLPHQRAVPWGLYEGSEVRLEGFIPYQSKGFQANFLYAQTRGATTPLRFGLHFEGPTDASSATVTLNSFINRQWGKEVKMRSTLRQGENITIRFIITGSGYKITENDRVLGEFPHRINPEYIRFMEISGELKLKYLRVPQK